MAERDLKREALRTVNAVRKVLGLRRLNRLPKGERGDNMGCPLARAFPGDVHVGQGSITASEAVAAALIEAHAARDCCDIFPGPHVSIGGTLLADFVNAFDGGEFPELVRQARGEQL